MPRVPIYSPRLRMSTADTRTRCIYAHSSHVLATVVASDVTEPNVFYRDTHTLGQAPPTRHVAYVSSGRTHEPSNHLTRTLYKKTHPGHSRFLWS